MQGYLKMTKPILILTFVLSFSLTKSAKLSNGDVKKEDATNSEVTSPKMPDNMTMEGQDNEDQEKTDDVNLMQVMSQCNESFRIEMVYLEALNRSGSFPDESDRTPKCYIRCVLETTGVMSEDGQFEPARAAVVVTAERDGRQLVGAEEMAAACSDRKESCKCERAYQFMKCFMEMILMINEKRQ